MTHLSTAPEKSLGAERGEPISLRMRIKRFLLHPLTFVFAVWGIAFLVAALCFAY